MKIKELFSAHGHYHSGVTLETDSRNGHPCFVLWIGGRDFAFTPSEIRDLGKAFSDAIPDKVNDFLKTSG